MRAMIFAAGLGTRLKPLTDSIPKALVPVGGKPLLQILIDRLAASGCTEATVNVHHFSEKVISYLYYNKQPIKINISDESGELLDTGGGIHKAARFFADGEPFLIHNVDILHNLDLQKFYEENVHSGDAVLLVSSRKTQRYFLFDDENNLVGWTNLKTGEVKSPYPNLDPKRYHMYAFGGIHIFNLRLFQEMDKWPAKFPIVDFYLSICDKYLIKGYLKEDLKLVDVGKLNTLVEAEKFLKNK